MSARAIKVMLRGILRGRGRAPEGERAPPGEGVVGEGSATRRSDLMESAKGLSRSGGASPAGQTCAAMEERPLGGAARRSDNSDDASNAGTPRSQSREQNFSFNSPPHTLPIEQGGVTIQELRRAMREESYVQDDVMPNLCEILHETIAANDAASRRRRHRPSGRRYSLFFSDDAAVQVTPMEFVKRILRLGMCSSCAIVVGLLYLQRLKQVWSEMLLTSETYQKLLLVAALVANKFCDDHGANNVQWARVARITIKELNTLELCFLFALDFDLGFQTEEYKSFLRQLLLAEAQEEHDVALSILRVRRPSTATLDTQPEFAPSCSLPATGPAPPPAHRGSVGGVDSDCGKSSRLRSSSLPCAAAACSAAARRPPLADEGAGGILPPERTTASRSRGSLL